MAGHAAGAGWEVTQIPAGDVLLPSFLAGPVADDAYEDVAHIIEDMASMAADGAATLDQDDMAEGLRALLDRDWATPGWGSMDGLVNDRRNVAAYCGLLLAKIAAAELAFSNSVTPGEG